MKTGYIAIIGEPNVGKSTLLNRLLGTKLSAVSSRPQTTRNRILGVLTDNDVQLCFIDTPGIIIPRYLMQEHMVGHIQTAIDDADIIIWMTDPWFKSASFPHNLLKKTKDKTIVAVVNKIDLVPRAELTSAVKLIQPLVSGTVIAVSALTGEGIPDLKKVLYKALPEGPFLYPTEDISDSPTRFFVAEIIREKIFGRFTKEIPYSTCVMVEEYREKDQGKDLIRAVIYVEKDSQKGILIGRHGAALKSIGEAARKDIEQLIGRPVYLDLWVKVKDGWRKDKKFLKEAGY